MKEIYLFRLSFGLLMMIYSMNKCTDDVYQPNTGVYFDFRHRIPGLLQTGFESFPWYTRSDLYWRIHCPLMLLAAVGIAFSYGSMSRLCCLLFSLLKGILLLLDQTKFNNHEYLYSTLALMLCLVDCHDIQEYSLSYCMSLKKSSVSFISSCGLMTSLAYLMLNNAVYGIPGIKGLSAVLLMWFSLIILLGDTHIHKSSDSNAVISSSLWFQRVSLQLFIGAVYFYAGLAKTDTDWLSGSTAKELLLHWSMDAGSTSSLAQQVVHRTTTLLSVSEEQFYVLFAYCGLMLDITAAPGLMAPFRIVRLFYTLLLIGFHTANHFLFILETFPFVMMSSCMLYHDSHWIDFTARTAIFSLETVENRCETLVKCCTHCWHLSVRSWQSIIKPLLLLSLLTVHLLVPLRCGIRTPLDLGSVSWSTSCQYFQWRMMTRSVRTVASHLRFVHPMTGEMQIVTLDMLGLNLCSHQQHQQQQDGGSDMCQELREFLLATPQYEDRLYQTIRDARNRAVSPEDAARGLVLPPRVYADVWLEINGPPIQRYIDPNVDIGGRDALSAGVAANSTFWSSLNGLVPGSLDAATAAPVALADWVMPRIEHFRSLEWIQRMRNITFSEREKQMRRWRKSGFNESEVLAKSKRLEVVFLTDVPSSGESYFYFYRSARVQLLQGRAFVGSLGTIDSSSAGEHLLQGIVKWRPLNVKKEVCELQQQDCRVSNSAQSEAVLWKIVLPDGGKHFDIKPFDDGRIKSVK